MNPLRNVCLLMAVFALASAYRGPVSNRNSLKNSWKPTDWLSVTQLESLPSMQEITLNRLEQMSVQEGGDLLNKMHHLALAGRAIEPSYVPKASEIPAFYITPDNKKVNFNLSELPKIAKEENNFGDQEVTIFITGLPQTTETVQKATRKLVQAYMQRYNGQAPEPKSAPYGDDDDREDDEWNSNFNKPSGNLVVILLGNVLTNINHYMTFDVEKTGIEIGNVLVELTDKADVPQEIVHVIGSNIAAHVAGAAGRQYTRETGHKLRRITGLDPSTLYAETRNALLGLARGDAEFVDAIHTSAYGLGTPIRCGDADFYPNGPSEGVPGADNVVEASMRAIRYFAESVIPGNERNFPAVGATSFKQYNEQNGNGKRIYMGINTDFDVQGDFILQVNGKSPFGRSTPAQKQHNYHNAHQPWKWSPQDF